MVEGLGLESERFALVWSSSAEADKFMAVVAEMTERFRRIGPTPFKEEPGQAVPS
jgi:F420-non-reducing hydrogenase iron-sulfur subunit